jgi:hypothetical protein
MKNRIYIYLLLGCAPSLLQASALADGKSCKPQEHCKVVDTAIQCLDFARSDTSPLVKAKYAQCKAVVTAKLDWSQAEGEALVAWVQRNPDVAPDWLDFTRKFQAPAKVGGKLNIDKSAAPGKALKMPSTSPTGSPSAATGPLPKKLDPSKANALGNLFSGGATSGASPKKTEPKTDPTKAPDKPKKTFGSPPPKIKFQPPTSPPTGRPMPGPSSPPSQGSPTTSVEAGFSTDGYLYAHKDLLSALSSTAPDVRRRFALDHYDGHGKAEARAFQKLPESFTPEEYLAINEDLAKVAPADPKARFSFAIDHFVHHGSAEHRQYHKLPSGFTAEGYLTLHPDVAGHAPQDPSRRVEFAMWHYLHHGANEGRSHGEMSPPVTRATAGNSSTSSGMPSGFTTEGYLNKNPDVAQAAPSDPVQRQEFAMWHYLNHGKAEGRKYSNIPPAPTGKPSGKIPPAPTGKPPQGKPSGIIPPAPTGMPPQAGIPPQGTPNANRGALFGDINKGGFQLKKTVTNDKSAPKLGQ